MYALLLLELKISILPAKREHSCPTRARVHHFCASPNQTSCPSRPMRLLDFGIAGSDRKASRAQLLPRAPQDPIASHWVGRSSENPREASVIATRFA